MHGGKGFSAAAFSGLSPLKSGAVWNLPTDSFYGVDNSSQTSMYELTHSLIPSLLCVNQGLTGRLGLTNVNRKVSNLNKIQRNIACVEACPISCGSSVSLSDDGHNNIQPPVLYVNM